MSLGGVYRPFATIISFHARTGLITMASLFSALVNAVLNFAFIPMFGQWACCMVYVNSAYCVYAGWVIFWAQKIDPISLDIKLIASIVKLGGGVLCVQQLFDMQNLCYAYMGDFSDKMWITQLVCGDNFL